MSDPTHPPSSRPPATLPGVDGPPLAVPPIVISTPYLERQQIADWLLHLPQGYSVVDAGRVLQATVGPVRDPPGAPPPPPPPRPVP